MEKHMTTSCRKTWPRHDLKECAEVGNIFTFLPAPAEHQLLVERRANIVSATDLELSEHTDRLHLPRVSAAHQVVLQHSSGGEGEVTHLAVHHVSHSGAGHSSLSSLRLTPLLATLATTGRSGAVVGCHAEQGTCFRWFTVSWPRESWRQTRRHHTMWSCCWTRPCWTCQHESLRDINAVMMTYQ